MYLNLNVKSLEGNLRTRESNNASYQKLNQNFLENVQGPSNISSNQLNLKTDLWDECLEFVNT